MFRAPFKQSLIVKLEVAQYLSCALYKAWVCCTNESVTGLGTLLSYLIQNMYRFRGTQGEVHAKMPVDFEQRVTTEGTEYLASFNFILELC